MKAIRLKAFCKRNKLVLFTVSCVAGVIAGARIFDDSADDYLAFISAATGLATLILAFALFDELDSAKTKFSKTLNAVESLIFSICNTEFDIFNTSGNDLALRHLSPIHTPVKFYLNEFNLAANSNAPATPFYYTEKMLKKFAPISDNINPWIPLHLREPLKGIFLYSKTKEFNLSSLKGQVYVIAAKDERLHSVVMVYQIWYDIRQEYPRLLTIKDFQERMTEILSINKNYFNEKLGESPDFRGD